MVRLTEEMITAKTRANDITTVKKLNCWGAELDDVSILQKMPHLKVLSLSINKISSLLDFANCHELQDLFLRKNAIRDLNEVCFLKDLPYLRNLWLAENPCAEEEGYRQSVIKTLPNLKMLDEKPITNEELQNALAVGKLLVHPLLEPSNSGNNLRSASNTKLPEEAATHDKQQPEDEKPLAKEEFKAKVQVNPVISENCSSQACNHCNAVSTVNCREEIFRHTGQKFNCPSNYGNKQNSTNKKNCVILQTILGLLNTLKELDVNSLSVVNDAVLSCMDEFKEQ